MRKFLLIYLGLMLFTFGPAFGQNEDSSVQPVTAETESVSNVKDTFLAQEDGNSTTQEDESNTEEGTSSEHSGDKEAHGDDHLPAVWSIIPFVLLLLLIATGPLFFEHFWHKNYPLIAILLGVLVVVYYIFGVGDSHHPIHALQEYVSFIALIASLFIASGGILIKIDKEGKPMVNIALLIFGALIANIIGTTGASMLLIRPFIRLNQNRVKPYHIVFFIFMVSNVGGCLTPIGDPPLFLGFLKGVPFQWTLVNLWMEWMVGIGLLAAVFFFLDKRNKADYDGPDEQIDYSGKISVKGAKNVVWLAIIIFAVFLDPNKIDWLPGIIEVDHQVIFGTKGKLTPEQVELINNGAGTIYSFIREILMFTVGILAYKTADKEALKGNEFDFEPVKEVAFIFIGIFATMMPALQLVSNYAKGAGADMINIHSLYWFTGSLSGVLDNAPTYMNFLAAGVGKAAAENKEVFTNAELNPKNVASYISIAARQLMAISVSSVFFGAMTYIGNAPNFMVKSIAEQSGIKMPAFASYVVKYSIPFLLPILFIVWVIFFGLPEWIG